MLKRERATVLAAYVPVIHRGYLEFFKQHQAVEVCCIFDASIISSVDYLRKDLRALSPVQQVQMVKATNIFKDVALMDTSQLQSLNNKHVSIVMPDEDISKEIAKQLPEADITFAPVFLRWDRQSVNINRRPRDEQTTSEASIQNIMNEVSVTAQTSPDIWRQVGAILIDANGQEINRAVNRGEPTEHTPWIDGDPRNVYKRGVAIELSVFTHAEAALIAEAARVGTSLEGATLYVGTYPCPACAKLIAHSGIKLCYYGEGYAVLDGQHVLDAYGVQTVRVEGFKNASAPKYRNVPYTK